MAAFNQIEVGSTLTLGEFAEYMKMNSDPISPGVSIPPGKPTVSNFKPCSGDGNATEADSFERDLQQKAAEVKYDYYNITMSGIISPSASKFLSYDDDRKNRQSEVSNFINKFKTEYLFSSQEDGPQILIVKSWEELEMALNQVLLESGGPHVTNLMIVYSGHGKEESQGDGAPSSGGLVFQQDRQCIKTNDDLINFVDKLLQPRTYPLKVTLIFAQCFGYLHAPPPDRIKMICLSHKGSPKTLTTYDAQGNAICYELNQLFEVFKMTL